MAVFLEVFVTGRNIVVPKVLTLVQVKSIHRVA